MTEPPQYTRSFNGYLSVDIITELNQDKHQMIDAVSCKGLMDCQRLKEPGDAVPIPEDENDEAPSKCVMCLSGFHNDQSGKLVQCCFEGKSCHRWFHQMCHDPNIQGDDVKNWQCGVCSGKDKLICYRCGFEWTSKIDSDELIACDYCDNWVHQKCHVPKLPGVPKGKFRCLACEDKKQQDKRKREAAKKQLEDAKAAAELSRLRHGRVGIATRSGVSTMATRCGRVSTPIASNNPDLRHIETRGTRINRMRQ